MKTLVTCLLWSAAVVDVQAAWRPEILRRVGVDQQLGSQVPLDILFRDEVGRPATLRQLSGKPVILALVYYQCPSLCNLVLNGVLRSAKSLSLSAGTDFEIVAVSFDARETPAMAAAKKAAYVKEYARQGSEVGWHFLTGAQTSSKMLADSVGFHFAYDPVTNQFAHGSAIIILTPDGKVAKYFYGVQYPARDLRLGLVEASQHRIGSIVDQVMLYCYHYDPSNGKYGFVIMNVLRVAGLVTVAVLAGFMFFMFRRDFRQRREL